MARGEIRLLASSHKIKRFSEILNRHELSAPIRVPRGRDIMAACGQLKSASERTRARDRTQLAVASVTSLPVLGTVLGAYAFVWQERRQFWRLTLPPLVILAILTALVQWGTVSFDVTWDGVRSFSVQRSGWVSVLSFVLLMLNIWVWLAYSVAWHRSYLLPAEGCSTVDAYRPHGRQIRFLWTACKIFLLMIPGLFVVPILVAFAATGVVLMLLGILAYGYVYIW